MVCDSTESPGQVLPPQRGTGLEHDLCLTTIFDPFPQSFEHGVNVIHCPQLLQPPFLTESSNHISFTILSNLVYSH